MKSFTAGPNENGVRLSRFVEGVTKDMPRSMMYKAFRNKRIKVNGKRAGVTRLSAELASGGKTYIFLLEDPEGFEKSTGVLQYLDGTVDDDPETADPDWREMVYRWTDCPVLTGLELGSYDGYTLMDDATGTNQSVLEHL